MLFRSFGKASAWLFFPWYMSTDYPSIGTVTVERYIQDIVKTHSTTLAKLYLHGKLYNPPPFFCLDLFQDILKSLKILSLKSRV